VLLADQGADVIHVDPPGGPRRAGVADAFFNRGKRRAILDLKQPGELAAARRLAASADVVIENFRPGVLAGLDLDAIGRASPALITCSLPGFGADDPRAAVRGYEGVIAAATANCLPRAGEEPPGWDWERPTYSALPLASSFAAYLAATSIVMALIARRRTGRPLSLGAGARNEYYSSEEEYMTAVAEAVHACLFTGRARGGRQAAAVQHADGCAPCLPRS
jgi:crotonobetainyl-CoA:carnitine CoA-transferase CaiB-like acyl-CoA transferase